MNITICKVEGREALSKWLKKKFKRSRKSGEILSKIWEEGFVKSIMKCYQLSNKIRIENFPLYLSISSHQWSWLNSGRWRFDLNLTAVRINNFLTNFLLNLKLKIVNKEVSSLISNLEKWNLISIITASKSKDNRVKK